MPSSRHHKKADLLHDPAQASVRDLVSRDPEAVIRALAPFVSDRRKEKIAFALENRTDWVTVVLDNLHDPHNAAAVLRTSDAFGVSTVHVLQDRNRFSVSRRVTQGAHVWLRIHRHPATAPCLTDLKAKGFRILAFDHRGDRSWDDLPDLVSEAPAALCFGNEHAGLDPSVLELSDHIVRIPMQGFVTCLNISVSVGIVLARLAPRIRKPLSPESALETKALWYARSVRGSQTILQTLSDRPRQDVE